MLVGGRNLGDAGAPAVRFTVSLDGRPVFERVVEPSPGFFVVFHDFAPGTLVGEGTFAQVAIAAEAADGSQQPVNAAIEQFDVQSAGRVVVGFGEGWHEAEYEPATGLHWRWTSERSTLGVRPSAGDLTVTIVGESPLRYYDAAPTVTLLACSREVGREIPARDFTWTTRVPSDALEACDGQISIATDRTFVPDERSHNGDRRRLGLRIFDVQVASGTRLVR